MNNSTSYKPEYPQIAKTFIQAGYTQKECAELIGITEKTWHNWKKAHPEFEEAVHKADAELVAIALTGLAKRAQGYDHIIEKDEQGAKQDQALPS